MDFLFAERVPELRSLLGIKPAKTDDNDVTDVVEPFLQVVHQHVFDDFAHVGFALAKVLAGSLGCGNQAATMMPGVMVAEIDTLRTNCPRTLEGCID